MTAPELVLLDVNETLADLEPLRDVFTGAGLPGPLMDTWFAATLRDGFALAASGAQAPFADVAAAALRVLLAGTDRGDDGADAVISDLLDAFPELPLHADVAPGLRALREAGIRLVTLTNGSVQVTESVLGRAGLLDLVERRLSVADAGHWKPHPASYAWALEQVGVQASRACLLAVHPWDTDGAARAGLRSAWLNRGGGPYPAVMRPADVTATDLPALAAALAAG